ncbi:MAG: branched-chain amino acid transaminase [Bdellovibrionales bacterium]|nr:branched-chain amino acid transaminase [Bdellovibrionales bacterium]
MFNHEELKVFFQGKIVDFKDATISVANTGFLYGLAVFTGMRAHYNEQQQKLFLFRPEDHYRRFRFACKLMRYEQFLKNYDYDRFLGVLLELLSVNNIEQDVYVRVTNYSDENRVTPKFVEYKDALTMFLYPLGDYVPTGGMRCKVSSYTRSEDNAIPARAKINGIYVNTAFAKTEALLNGYDEAIFLDKNGHVVEGSAENIFLVIDGKLVTPAVSDNILEGITRRTVIDIAQDEGIEVVERTVDRTELYKADEVFLTGTGAKVSPVVEIDKYAVGNGTVGPIAAKIQETYMAAVRGELERYKHWLVDVYDR